MDCPKLKGKTSNANIAREDDNPDIALTGSTFICHSNERILNAGCTYHMCLNRDWFSDFSKIDGGTVLMGNNNACKTQGIGSIRLKLHDGTLRDLTEVWYVPNLRKNLISLGTLDSKGFRINIEGGVLKLVVGALVIMKGVKHNNLDFCQGSIVEGGASTVYEKLNKVDSNTTKLWHMRLGHAGEKALQSQAKQGLLKGAKTWKLTFCEHCVMGKQTLIKFGIIAHCTKGTLDYVHTDVWGPTKVASLGGKHWFVTFVDDYSRRVWVYTMKRKSEVLDIFLD